MAKKSKIAQAIEAAGNEPEAVKADAPEALNERVLSAENFFAALNTESENKAPEATPSAAEIPKPIAGNPATNGQFTTGQTTPPTPEQTAQKTSVESTELLAFVIVLIAQIANSAAVNYIAGRPDAAKDYKPEQKHLSQFEKELADYLKTRTITMSPALSLTIAGLAVFAPSLIGAYMESENLPKAPRPTQAGKPGRGRPRKNF